MQPYLTFDPAGAYTGRGVCFDPPGDDGRIALPEGAVACSEPQYDGAGSWTSLASGAIVLGTRPTPPAVIAYLPPWLIRQRLTAANLWAQAVDAMTPAQQLEFATLEEGIDPADENVAALLAAIGADPAAILAPV